MPTEEGRASRIELLVQSVTDYAIYMLDPTGVVVSWNAGAERFKGYKPDEIIGQHFSRFYSEADRAAGIPTRALETARTEGRFEAEGWRMRKDGTRISVEFSIIPFRDEAGVMLGMGAILRDVTKRFEEMKALRAALKAAKPTR